MSVPFKSFTAKSDRHLNILFSDAWIGRPFRNVPASELNPESQHAKQYLALWDTGATHSVLSEKVIRECGLVPIAATEVRHAGGRTLRPVFFVSLWLPNHFVIHEIKMTLGEISDGLDILIGMDVIGQGDFAVTNHQGKTAFSFRIPSLECIDFNDDKYVPSQTVRALPAVGRNDPCPCKSGKKYKHCCMNKTATI